jgi:hypothetical protein
MRSNVQQINQVRIRDDFRQRIWIDQAQKLGGEMEQRQKRLKSVQMRALELHPELGSNLSIKSSYFNVTEDGACSSGDKKGFVNLRKAIKAWRQFTARAEDWAIKSQSPLRGNLEIFSNEKPLEKFPIRPVDSGSHRYRSRRAVPAYDESDVGYRIPRNSGEAGMAFLKLDRTEPRPSEIGLSPREGFRRAATRQKSTRKSKAQSSLYPPQDASKTNVRGCDNNGTQHNQRPRSAPYPHGSAEASRQYKRRRRDFKAGRNHQLSDRVARRSKDRSNRDGVRRSSTESHATDRQRDHRKRTPVEPKRPNARVHGIRPWRRERLTAMEITREGSRRR